MEYTETRPLGAVLLREISTDGSHQPWPVNGSGNVAKLLYEFHSHSIESIALLCIKSILKFLSVKAKRFNNVCIQVNISGKEEPEILACNS